MPRGPRLDAPDALHHVIARGIERRAIFEHEGDRQDFLGGASLSGARSAGPLSGVPWPGAEYRLDEARSVGGISESL